MKPYELWLVAGAAAAWATTLLLARGRGIPSGRLFAALSAGGIGAVVGARALHVALHPGANPFAAELEGFALDGALLGLLLAMCLAGGRASLRILDLAAPGLGLGIALARVGYWLNGCCFGAVTDVPWAVPAPAASVGVIALPLLGATSPKVLVHPTQFYELAAALFGAALALWILKSSRRVGLAFALFLFWMEGFRAFAFRLRSPDESALLWPGFLPAMIALLAAFAAFRILRRPPSEFESAKVVGP